MIKDSHDYDGDGNDSDFEARGELTFIGGPSGDWSTGQVVTLKSGTVELAATTSLLHAVHGWPDYVDGAGPRVLLRVTPK